MGLSEWDVRDFSLEATIRDLAAVVDRVATEKVALFALSQGGPTAIAYAQRHPDRVSHLILYGTFARMSWFQDDKKGRQRLRVGLKLMESGWDNEWRKTFADWIMPEGDLEAVHQLDELQGASTSCENAVRHWKAMAKIDVSGLLRQVRVPTLVMHRKGDTMVPLKSGWDLARATEGARFVRLEGKNHLPLPEEPVREEMYRIIEDFVSGDSGPESEVTTGHVLTILFTDMESSSALRQRLGDARAQELVRTHNSIVRNALRAHGGSEIKHTGDGIMASFPVASGALECAVAIQRGVAAHVEQHPDAPLGVYVGLNAGEPIAEEKDLFGTSVDLARRICDQADPGQILVSDVVRQLAMGKGFLFSDRGDVVLRGFEDRVRLYEVRWREDG